MTSRSIANQVKTIQKATKKASVSKEAAMAFLSQAGILSEPKVAVPRSTRKNAGIAKHLKVVDIIPEISSYFKDASVLTIDRAAVASFLKTHRPLSDEKLTASQELRRFKKNAALNNSAAFKRKATKK